MEDITSLRQRKPRVKQPSRLLAHYEGVTNYSIKEHQLADSKNRRPQTDFQTFGGSSDWTDTGAQDRNARNGKGGISFDTSATEAASGAAGFEGSCIDEGTVALNTSSTAKSGGSKSETV